MVTLRWSAESRSGTHGTVTLVELVVENPDDTATRIRIGNRLDGPVWPPRSDGVPEAGWDDGGFEGVVEGDDRISLGYASPGTRDDPPVEVVWTERAETPREDRPPSDPPRGAGLDSSDVVVDAEPTVHGAIRALEDPRPPSDAVPLPTDERPDGDVATAGEGVDAVEQTAVDGEPTATVADEDGVAHEDGEGGPETTEDDPMAEDDSTTTDDSDTTAQYDDELPGQVVAWLDVVEGRVERREALSDARSLAAAAEAVGAEGGLEATEALLATIRDDREALRALEARAADLRERADADVPLDAYRRLA